jgi:hypothetical protein
MLDTPGAPRHQRRPKPARLNAIIWFPVFLGSGTLKEGAHDHGYRRKTAQRARSSAGAARAGDAHGVMADLFSAPLLYDPSADNFPLPLACRVCRLTPLRPVWR